MTTRQAMIQEIESDAERSDSGAITAKIDAAIRHYQRHRFFFNESRSVTFNTVASTAAYTFSAIGSTFYRLDAAYITDAGEIYELRVGRYWNYETLVGTSAATARPTDYAYVAETLRLWPLPDAVYEVRLTGHIKLAAPASDSEANNDWMTEAYDLIKARACAELFAIRWENPQMGLIHREAELVALRALQGDTHDKVSTGHLEATEF